MTIESEEFYNICQKYRHAQDFGPAGNAYESLIQFIEEYSQSVIEDYKASLVPVGYMYQHEETGNIGFIDQWQVDNGFEKNNPRLKIITSLYSSPQPIEKCEPVAEALHERNRHGYAVVDLIGTLYEIIENAQEVEVDDFLHIAIPIDKWHELQDALEEMPKRAELYTSPISKEWVDVPYEERRELYKSISKGNINGFADLLSARLKQLNAPKE